MEKNRIMTKKNKTTENDFCKVANRVSFITIIGNVILSVVDTTIPPEDIEKCKQLADSIGVTLRVRPFE